MVDSPTKELLRVEQSAELFHEWKHGLLRVLTVANKLTVREPRCWGLRHKHATASNPIAEGVTPSILNSHRNLCMNAQPLSAVTPWYTERRMTIILFQQSLGCRCQRTGYSGNHQSRSVWAMHMCLGYNHYMAFPAQSIIARYSCSRAHTNPITTTQRMGSFQYTKPRADRTLRQVWCKRAGMSFFLQVTWRRALYLWPMLWRSY